MTSSKAKQSAEGEQAPKRKWEKAGKGYPGVYVSSLKPAEAVREEKPKAWRNRLLRQYHVAAKRLAGLDDT